MGYCARTCGRFVMGEAWVVYARARAIVWESGNGKGNGELREGVENLKHDETQCACARI